MSEIDLFNWNLWPLELNNCFFTINLLNTNTNTKPRIINYIKHIFPKYTYTNNMYDLKNIYPSNKVDKNNLEYISEFNDVNNNKILLIDTDTTELNYQDLLYLNTLYECNNYIIVIGKNIPYLCYTNSHVILFDNLINVNNFLKPKQSINDNFPLDKAFIICDNRTGLQGSTVDELNAKIKLLNTTYFDKF